MYKSNNNMRDFLLLNEKQKEFQTRKNEEERTKIKIFTVLNVYLTKYSLTKDTKFGEKIKQMIV